MPPPVARNISQPATVAPSKATKTFIHLIRGENLAYKSVKPSDMSPKREDIVESPFAGHTPIKHSISEAVTTLSALPFQRYSGSSRRYLAMQSFTVPVPKRLAN